MMMMIALPAVLGIPGIPAGIPGIHDTRLHTSSDKTMLTYFQTGFHEENQVPLIFEGFFLKKKIYGCETIDKSYLKLNKFTKILYYNV